MRKRTLSTAAVAAWLLATASAASAAPPSNDAFEGAAPFDGRVAGTVDEATRQPGEPAHGSFSVWYAYRPATSERVALRLTRADSMNAVVAVYTGPGVGSLREVADSQETGYRVPFEAVAGQTYWISVASTYEPAGSLFELRLDPAPLPANDAFADAERVAVPSRTPGSLADATDELGEPRHRGQRARSTTWYRFRAPRTGRLTVEASESECGDVAVYTGSELTSLRPVAKRGYGAVRFTARRGRTYRVAVFCSGQGGDYELTVSDGSIKGKGVEMALAGGQTVDGIRTRGLRAQVTAERKVHVSLALIVSRTTARRLGLGDRVLGRAKGTLSYNQKLPAVIRLSGDAKRALDGESALSGVLRLTLLKTDAPNRVLDVPVRLPN